MNISLFMWSVIGIYIYKICPVYRNIVIVIFRVRTYLSYNFYINSILVIFVFNKIITFNFILNSHLRTTPQSNLNKRMLAK